MTAEAASETSASDAAPSSCGTAKKSASACGCSGNPVFDGVDPRYKMVLWIVIGLNGLMFVVEMMAGHLAGSQALKADALDFLGDTLTYGISLAVIGMPVKVRSTAALMKGVSLLGMGAWVMVTTIIAMMGPGLPAAPVMGVVGFAALAANLISVMLLAKWKDGDANVRSVWLCSRNDAIGNVAVMFAALGVWGSSTGWPDLIVALGMAGLFLSSAVSILRQSVAEYRAA
ncbi:MAG: cation transporter [Alphaproteobacteria bacterium]